MNYNDRDWCQYRKGSKLLNKSLLYALWEEWLLHRCNCGAFVTHKYNDQDIGLFNFVRGNQKSKKNQAKRDLTDKADYSLLEEDFTITVVTKKKDTQ